MSFQGIGVDIVDIKRFSPTSRSARKSFFDRVFTNKERAYCEGFKDSAPHFAGTFAAKEAASKALGGTVGMTSFEIRRTKTGKPELWRANKRCSALAVSISHDGGYAIAVSLAR